MYNGKDTYLGHSFSLQKAAQGVGLPRPPPGWMQNSAVQADSGDREEAFVLPQDS